MNRELGADFDLSSYRHEARWNSVERRIEMHLRSVCRQTVQIPAASLRVMLDENETIWTESSHKYKAEEIPDLAARTRIPLRGTVDQRAISRNLLVAG
jgi:uncharacterized SAM-dependent methyltransferase